MPLLLSLNMVDLDASKAFHTSDLSATFNSFAKEKAVLRVLNSNEGEHKSRSSASNPFLPALMAAFNPVNLMFRALSPNGSPVKSWLLNQF